MSITGTIVIALVTFIGGFGLGLVLAKANN